VLTWWDFIGEFSSSGMGSGHINFGEITVGRETPKKKPKGIKRKVHI